MQEIEYVFLCIVEKGSGKQEKAMPSVLPVAFW